MALKLGLPPALLAYRPKPTLEGCGIDVRRIIYDLLLLTGQSVHLTQPETVSLCDCPVPYSIASGCRGLMRTCRLINGEITSLIYGGNEFSFSPRKVRNCFRTVSFQHFCP